MIVARLQMLLSNLCLHMCDKEFIAMMVSSVLSYAMSPSCPRRRSSQQHIIWQRVSDIPRFPDVPNFLPIPAAHLNGGDPADAITEDRSSDSQIRLYPGSFASPINSHHLLATYRRLRPPIILRSDFHH